VPIIEECKDGTEIGPVTLRAQTDSSPIDVHRRASHGKAAAAEARP